jgi:hypothetical protein
MAGQVDRWMSVTNTYDRNETMSTAENYSYPGILPAAGDTAAVAAASAGEYERDDNGTSSE